MTKLTPKQATICAMLDQGIRQNVISREVKVCPRYVNDVARWKSNGFVGRPTTDKGRESYKRRYSKRKMQPADARASGKPFTCLKCGRPFGNLYQRICPACEVSNNYVYL